MTLTLTSIGSGFEFVPPLACRRIWQTLISGIHFSAKVGQKWKWSNGVRKGKIYPFWCISITNDIKSYKKINERAQTANFSVFTMGGHWLTGALCWKRWKQWKLKRELLKILNWYDLSRVGPCRRARPQLSDGTTLDRPYLLKMLSNLRFSFPSFGYFSKELLSVSDLPL